jgi:GMP synthase-like glutamine amidotransferase
MAAPITRMIVLQHVPQEGPVRIASVAERQGLKVDVLRLDQGASVPDRPIPGAILVVMGGPMGVGDLADARWPFLAREVALLRACLAEQAPVLGICLGSQLLAHAAGAAVVPLMCGEPPARHREVGWGAVHFLKQPAEEPVLEGLDRSELVLHWHGDTFALPEGASHLAASLACPGQMFRLGRSFGLQFHIEIDEPTVRTWVAEDAEFIRAANGADGAARILADTARFLPAHRPRGDRLIGNILRLQMSDRR